MFNKLVRLFKRSSLENPSTPITDDDDDDDGSVAGTGITVSRSVALNYAAVWRAVNLISRDVGKLPLFVYAREGEGGKRRAKDHPAFRLLRHEPNSEMSSLVFRQTIQAHVLLHGNGYANIIRSGAGVPLELIPLDPTQTYPVRVGGKLYYVVHIAGRPLKLLAENVLHIRGLGFDGLQGYSVLSLARDSIALGLTARQYGEKFFRNSARPATVLEYPGKLSDEAMRKLNKSWQTMHAGIDNAHKTAILEEGMKVNTLAISARDSQLLETRQFEIREIADWFGVPPHKLGDTTRTAYASLEQENQSYLDDALDGWLCSWEEEGRAKLLTEQEKANDTHIIEFLRPALVRADLTARANYYRTATAGAPWMTINEVRAAESMNELDDEEAGEIHIPLNIQAPQPPAEQPPALPPPTEPPLPEPPARSVEPTPLHRAAQAALDDAIGRMVHRLATHARKAVKRPESFGDWLEGALDEHRGVIIDAVQHPVTVAALAGLDSRTPGRVADDLLAELRTVLAAVYDTVPQSEFAAKIETAILRFEKRRKE